MGWASGSWPFCVDVKVRFMYAHCQVLQLIPAARDPTLGSMAGQKSKKSSIQESIGNRIRRLRLAHGLTQQQLADRVGLSRRMLAYYEIQGGEPRPDLLVRFAQVLDASVDALTGFQSSSRKAVPPRPENPHLWRRLKRIEELPLHDRKTILKMIDAMADARRRAS
jgi:transcriptional regulator with XRE-family HTH domain